MAEIVYKLRRVFVSLAILLYFFLRSHIRGTQQRFPPKYDEDSFLLEIPSTFRSQEMHSNQSCVIKFVSVSVCICSLVWSPSSVSIIICFGIRKLLVSFFSLRNISFDQHATLQLQLSRSLSTCNSPAPFCQVISFNLSRDNYKLWRDI